MMTDSDDNRHHLDLHHDYRALMVLYIETHSGQASPSAKLRITGMEVENVDYGVVEANKKNFSN